MISDAYLARLSTRCPTTDHAGFSPVEMAQFVHILPDLAGELLAFRRASRAVHADPDCQGLQARLYLARQVAAKPYQHTTEEVYVACQTMALHSGNRLEVEAATQAITEMDGRAA